MPENNPRAATVRRILDLVAPLTNYERTRVDPPRWSLDNIRAMLARPGATDLRAQVVQVGGSKGKGTTASYLAALGHAVGLRTGLYLSPHVEDVLERVQVDFAPAPALADAVADVVAFVRSAGLVDASFFEVMTAAAVECFARAGVDLVALEVGLGGRLDATTAVPVHASILTTVELEHTELLGSTVVEIAGEKAWIVRAGRPAYTAIAGEALAVVEARARLVGAPVFVRGREFRATVDVARDDHLRGTLHLPHGALPFELPGGAGFEVDALALATACLVDLRPDLRNALAAALLPVVRPPLPARFERVAAPFGTVIVDGAHTEQSLAAVAIEAARAAPNQRWRVLFGSALGKRWREGLSRLLPLVDSAVVISLDGTASEDPSEIAAWLRDHGVGADVAASAVEGVAALGTRPGPWLVVGSFYLAGRVRQLLRDGARVR